MPFNNYMNFTYILASTDYKRHYHLHHCTSAVQNVGTLTKMMYVHFATTPTTATTAVIHMHHWHWHHL